MMPPALDGDQMSHYGSVLPLQITQIFCSTCLISRSVTHLGCLLWWFSSTATFMKSENNLDHDFTSRTSQKARQTGEELFLRAVFVGNPATTPTSQPCGHLLEVQVCTEKTRTKKTI